MFYSFVDVVLTVSKGIVCNVVRGTVKEDETVLWVNEIFGEDKELLFTQLQHGKRLDSP